MFWSATKQFTPAASSFAAARFASKAGSRRRVFKFTGPGGDAYANVGGADSASISGWTASDARCSGSMCRFGCAALLGFATVLAFFGFAALVGHVRTVAVRHISANAGRGGRAS